MKLLTTLLFLTISTFTFASVPAITESKIEVIYVSKKVHDQLEAQYEGLIDKVNSNLFSSETLDANAVRNAAFKVLNENVNCNRESQEEIHWCELKKSQLLGKLTEDVMKSEVYRTSAQINVYRSMFSNHESDKDNDDSSSEQKWFHYQNGESWFGLYTLNNMFEAGKKLFTSILLASFLLTLGTVYLINNKKQSS